jgi:hypothetical protein
VVVVGARGVVVVVGARGVVVVVGARGVVGVVVVGAGDGLALARGDGLPVELPVDEPGFADAWAPVGINVGATVRPSAFTNV